MIQTHGKRTFQLLGLVSFSIFLVGCGGGIDFPFTVTEHPAGEKFNLKTKLVITPQLLADKWEITGGGGHLIYLGEPFSQNAEHLV